MKNKKYEDCMAMIKKIYVKKGRTDFIYISDKWDNCYSHPRVKMVTFENRELSDLMWDTILDVESISSFYGEVVEPLTIPEMINVLEDAGYEIVEE